MRLLTPAEVATRLSTKKIHLLTPYTRSGATHKLECKVCGHRWKTIIGSVLSNGRGCPKCGRQKLGEAQRTSASEVEKRLAKRQIRLLEDFTGARHRYTFKCLTCKHKWRTTANSVFGGTGCPKCSRRTGIEEATRLTIKDIKARLKELRSSVRVLDKTYTNNHTPLRLSCRSCDHKWRKGWHLLECSGGKCPRCHPHKFGHSEREVRQIIERMTGWKFPKAYPKWLKGYAERNPELDGYNERHQVAFEYQGPHHYKVVKYGGSNGKHRTLKEIKLMDARKREACKYHGVTLICIPYFKTDVEGFIRKKLHRAGLLTDP